MKILYDYSAFESHFSGVSKCFCELISHRPKGAEIELAVKESNNVHLRESGIIPNLKAAKLDRDAFVRKVVNIRGANRIYNTLTKIPFIPTSEGKNRRYSIKCLKKRDYDLFHVTTFTTDYFLSLIGNKPFVYTIHDMIHERFPQYFGEHNKVTDVKRVLCNKAAAVVCISEQSKRDLIEILNVPEEKIHVIYHGGPDPIQMTDKAIINEPYFLFVGTRGGYKNFSKTLDDFKIFSDRHDAVKLVCTAKPFTNEEKAHIAALGLDNRIIQVRVNDYELKNLYTYAIAFIHPSLYEGFGMPTLEAFAQGCPCLLNNNSCFPEVGGDAAFYFHSDGTTSNLPDVLEHVYGLKTSERDAVVKKGFEQLSKFSWTGSSEKLWGVYKQILEKQQ